MPRFEVEINGKRYEAEADSREKAVAAVRKMLDEQPSVATDVLRSGATGLARGAMALGGLEGDINSMLGSGIDWAKRQAGLNTSQPTETNFSIVPGMGMARQFGLMPRAPTTQQIESAVETAAGRPLPEPQTRAGRYAETAASFLPAAALPGPGSLGLRLLSGAAAGAGSEAAGEVAQEHMPSAEPWARVAGGLVGGMVPGVAARAVTPLPVSRARGAAATTLRREGVRPTAGQVTGRNWLRYREAAGGMERDLEGFTRAALRRIGVDAAEATPEVIDRAATQIGQQFDDLARNTTMRIDRRLVNDMMRVANDYTQVGGVAPVVRNEAARIVERWRGGQLTQSGEIYQGIRSRLNRLGRQTSDPQLKMALYHIQDALDGAMQRTAIAAKRPDWVKSWKDVRQKYRNLLIIENAAVGGGEASALGLITPERLRQAVVTIGGRRSYARGKGDFADLARAGNATMRALPQSGTAPRLRADSLMGLGRGGGAGGMTYLLTKDPQLSAAAGMAGMFGPPLVNAGITSRIGQRALSNQVFPAAGNLGEAGLRALMLQGLVAPSQMSSGW